MSSASQWGGSGPSDAVDVVGEFSATPANDNGQGPGNDNATEPARTGAITMAHPRLPVLNMTSARSERLPTLSEDPLPKKPRGFAALSPERRKEISSRGGKKSHELGRAHEWTADEARIAGRKGGRVSSGRSRKVG